MLAVPWLIASHLVSWLATHWIAGTPLGASLGGLESSLALLPTYGVLHALIRRRWRGSHAPVGLDLALGVPLLWFAGLNHRWMASPGSERVVAAMLYLTAVVILLRTMNGTGALRRFRRAERERRRPPLALAVVAFAFLVLLTPWTLSQRAPDGDEPWYLLVTHSLAFDFDAVLDNNYQRQDSLAFMGRAIEPQPGDPRDRDGNLRSRHGNALPILLAPGYRLAGRTGAALTMAGLTALFAWLILHWLLSVFGPRAALPAVFGLTVVTSPLLLYASQIWVEVPAGVLVVWALVCLERLRTGVNPRGLLGLLISVVLLPVLKLRFGLLSLAIIGVAIVRLPIGRRPRILFAGIGALGLLAVLAINAARFGNPLRQHAWQEILMPITNPVPTVQRLLGYLFDPAFGLVAFAPFWLLVVPGLWWLVRSARSQALVLGAVFGPYLIYAAARQEWYGGWSPPFRYALVSLPLIVTAVAAASLHRRHLGARLLWPGLAGLSVALGATWTAVPGWTFNFANGSALWLDRLSLQTGIDWMIWAPSAARPTRVSWIVPVLLIGAVLAAWNLGPRRADRRTLTVGACVLLASLTLGCLTITRMPTRLIEAESALVTKTGGQPEPPRWTFDRTRFPEAWTLPNGAELVAPIRPGGPRLELEITSLFIRNRNEDLVVHLERRTGDGAWEEVGGFRLKEPGWATNRLGPVDWEGADRLRIRAGAPLFDREPGVLNGVSVDRVRLHWR